MLGTVGLSACVGGGSSVNSIDPSADKLTFSLAGKTIPFPNDLTWAAPNPAEFNQAGIVDLSGTTSDPAANPSLTP